MPTKGWSRTPSNGENTGGEPQLSARRSLMGSMSETEADILRRRVADLEQQLAAMQANGHGPSAAQSPPQASKQALLAREGKYRSLFESIDQGFCIVEVLFDEHDLPVDCRFAEVNPAFEAQTGLVNAVGRRMRELAPAHEQYWIDIYGRIARTGVPERFENRADALGRWYEVYAFRIGQAEQCQVAILFNDIGPRKRAEAALRESHERLRALVTASAYVLYRMSPDWTEMRQLDGQGFLPDTARPSTTWLQQYIDPSDEPHVMEAIEKAVRTKEVPCPDLMLLDLNLPKGDGHSGLTEFRKHPDAQVCRSLS